MIQSALMRPSATASNMSTAFRPGRVGDARRAPEAAHAIARSAASSSSICAASWLARPPTSRPPMALGWPVIENGPAPGLPMRPVARWQLMIALTLSVPCADWLTPWRTAVTRARRAGEQFVEARRSRAVEAAVARRPRVERRSLGARRRALRRSPSACAATQSRIDRAGAARDGEQAVEQRDVAARRAAPDAGRRSSPVAVRRGSITTSVAPRRRSRRHRSAGTAPDGTRRCWSRPARPGRPRRDPRSSRARRPRRRRG